MTTKKPRAGKSIETIGAQVPPKPPAGKRKLAAASRLPMARNSPDADCADFSPRSVARLIVGDVPPDWLTEAVGRAAQVVGAYLRWDAGAPKRAELKKRLIALRKTASLVHRELHDMDIEKLLAPTGERVDEDGVDQWRCSIRGMVWIAERVGIALEEQEHRHGGAGRMWNASQNSGVSAEETAGAVVAVLWRAASGVAVAVTNDRAIQAWRDLLRLGGHDGSGASNQSAIRYLRFGRDDLSGAKRCAAVLEFVLEVRKSAAFVVPKINRKRRQ